MTDLTPLLPAGRQVVESYGDGGFRISGRLYRGSLLIFPDRVQRWPAAALAELDRAAFAPLLEAARGGEVELVLLGTGSRQRFPHPRLTRPLMDARVGLEVMDTQAACRTYNILAAESRKVAAALLVED